MFKSPRRLLVVILMLKKQLGSYQLSRLQQISIFIHSLTDLFFTTISTSKKASFSQREVERELKMALRNTLRCAALSVLLHREPSHLVRI